MHIGNESRVLNAFLRIRRSRLLQQSNGDDTLVISPVMRSRSHTGSFIDNPP